MSLYIDSGGTFHHDLQANFALKCPHCQTMAHMTPVSVPQYAALVAFRPSHVGIVYRCDSCNAPVFLKYPVRLHAANRIELSSEFSELERAPEQFDFTFLPEEAETLFRESLRCFAAGAHQAFASMCRRTAQSVFAELGENGKLRMFDALNDVREIAELDPDTFNAIRKVLFGTDTEPRPNTPLLDDFQSGVLLEVMKDLLYQIYVRKGQLMQALTVRRHTLEDTHSRIVAGFADAPQ